jgi:regulator of nucleoside diphosphate kinase
LSFLIALRFAPEEIHMIAQHTSLRPHVILTAADYDRLRALVDSPRYRTTHATLLLSLAQELDRCEVVQADEVPKGVVTMHSRVRVRDVSGKPAAGGGRSRGRKLNDAAEDPTDGDGGAAADETGTEEYTLVYPDEADIDDGKLSVLAPLGIALLGTRVGQTLEFQVPAGTRRLRVEKILYQPEAAGDFHL